MGFSGVAEISICRRTPINNSALIKVGIRPVSLTSMGSWGPFWVAPQHPIRLKGIANSPDQLGTYTSYPYFAACTRDTGFFELLLP